MTNDPKLFLSQVFTAPIGDFIGSVGQGVAEAQADLDQGSIEATLAVYDSHGDKGLEILRQIGYQPNWYALRNVKGELNMSLSLHATETTTSTTGSGLRMYGMSVNSTTQNTYGLSGQSSAKLSFEIVPVPPQEQIRRVPDVSTMTPEQAFDALARIGLEPTFVFPTNADETSAPNNFAILEVLPPTGDIVVVDSEITIMLE